MEVPREGRKETEALRKKKKKSVITYIMNDWKKEIACVIP